jgi:hypothetical protein
MDRADDAASSWNRLRRIHILDPSAADARSAAEQKGALGPSARPWRQLSFDFRKRRAFRLEPVWPLALDRDPIAQPPLTLECPNTLRVAR